MASKKKINIRPADMGLANYQHPDQFGQWLGYRVIRVDRANHIAVSELEIRGDHLSPAARVHGGVISAFFDFTCGAAVFSTMETNDYASTVEIKVNYLRPLHLGDCLRAEAKVVFRGKRLCVIHAFLYRNEEKKPAAMATATFNIISGNDPSKTAQGAAGKYSGKHPRRDQNA